MHTSPIKTPILPLLDIIDDLADKYHPKYLALDTGYGTPEILERLGKRGITPNELKLLKRAKEVIESEQGIELYSHRGNKCESPHGFIKYNLNGKKFKMRGLARNNTSIKLHSLLYNLTRLISIKSIIKNDLYLTMSKFGNSWINMQKDLNW